MADTDNTGSSQPFIEVVLNTQTGEVISVVRTASERTRLEPFNYRVDGHPAYTTGVSDGSAVFHLYDDRTYRVSAEEMLRYVNLLRQAGEFSDE